MKKPVLHIRGQGGGHWFRAEEELRLLDARIRAGSRMRTSSVT